MTSHFLLQKVHTWLALTFVGTLALLAGTIIRHTAQSADDGTLAVWSFGERVERMDESLR